MRVCANMAHRVSTKGARMGFKLRSSLSQVPADGFRRQSTNAAIPPSKECCETGPKAPFAFRTSSRTVCRSRPFCPICGTTMPWRQRHHRWELCRRQWRVDERACPPSGGACAVFTVALRSDSAGLLPFPWRNLEVGRKRFRTGTEVLMPPYHV